MNDFWKIFLVEDPRKLPSAGPRHVSLAAFGKHAGWDDHVEDLGLETESLTLAKAILYVEGIGGQIDSGAWEKLDSSQQLSQFNHLFLWQRSGQYLLGKMWSSTDGKGRTRYPMIVCVHCVGLTLPWILDALVPRLDALQTACIAAKSAGEVKGVLADTLSAMRRMVAELPQDSALHRTMEISAESFIKHPDLGPGREGLLRILHQIKDQMCGYTGNKASARINPADLRPQQIRVPVCAESPAKAFLAWSRFFDLQFVAGAPVLCTVPLGENWVDVTIGRPASNEFFSLRASAKSIPLASGIPYNIDDSVRQEGERIVNLLLSGKTRTAAPDQAAPSGGNTSFFAALKEKFSNGRIIVAAVSLAAIGALLLAKSNSSSTGSKSEVAEVPMRDVTTLNSGARPNGGAANQDAVPGVGYTSDVEQVGTASKERSTPNAARQNASSTQPAEPAPTAFQNREPGLPAKSPAAAEVTNKVEETASRVTGGDTAIKLQPQDIKQSVKNEQPDSDVIKEAAETRLAARERDLSGQKVALQTADLKTESLQGVDVAAKNDSKIQGPNLSEGNGSVVPAVTAAVALASSESPIHQNAPTSTNKELVNKLGLKLVWVPGVPGTPEGAWVGQYEVTQEEFQKVMGINPSVFNSKLLTNDFKWSNRLPVDSVSWIQAVEFCRKMTEQEGELGNLPKGWKYALPTDIQWTFLAAEVAVTNAVCSYPTTRSFPEQVGKFLPNQFGLHDVWGNLSELCVNLSGKTGAQGGSFENKSAKSLAIRENMQPHETRPRAGFRCVVIPAS